MTYTKFLMESSIFLFSLMLKLNIISCFKGTNFITTYNFEEKKTFKSNNVISIHAYYTNALDTKLCNI